MTTPITCPVCGAVARDVTIDGAVHTCDVCHRSWRPDARGPIVVKTITAAPQTKRDTWAASIAGEAAKIGRHKTSKTFR